MFSRLLNGLVVIVLGFLLLMNTTGYLPWSVWDSAISYWPLLLMGLGIQIAVSKREIPGLALALIAMMILGAIKPCPQNKWQRRIVPGLPTSFKGAEMKTFEVPLENQIGEIEVLLEAPSFCVKMKGDKDLNLPEDMKAFSADLAWEHEEPSSLFRFSQDGKALEISIKSTKDIGKQDWDLRLNPSTPVSLVAKGAVANIEGDCREIPLENLEVQGGVSKVNLVLGLSGRAGRVDISGGVTDFDLTLPDSVGVKIMLSGSPFLSHDFSGAGLFRTGDSWVSDGYDNANSTLDIVIRCGSGKVAINRVDITTWRS